MSSCDATIACARCPREKLARTRTPGASVSARPAALPPQAQRLGAQRDGVGGIMSGPRGRLHPPGIVSARHHGDLTRRVGAGAACLMSADMVINPRSCRRAPQHSATPSPPPKILKPRDVNLALIQRKALGHIPSTRRQSRYPQGHPPDATPRCALTSHQHHAKRGFVSDPIRGW